MDDNVANNLLLFSCDYGGAKIEGGDGKGCTKEEEEVDLEPSTCLLHA
jgi:hypothetical protein